MPEIQNQSSYKRNTEEDYTQAQGGGHVKMEGEATGMLLEEPANHRKPGVGGLEPSSLRASGEPPQTSGSWS